MQATTHVPKILKKLAETKGMRVWDDAFRSYNDPRFVSFGHYRIQRFLPKLCSNLSQRGIAEAYQLQSLC
ncbi:hypothetical protein [Candidatus Midichloria mitochondrii]|uniref:hypothetical protein n=1 Tax=Candidatus Midichloria mitochondrii TaxID=234827 RepID=UPI0011D2885A|nr:hypothetical protein [Candidatus Midichloria mitochondrii]